MKGLIAFSIISLLAGTQNFAKNTENFFHHGHSQEEIHESAEAKLHEHEPFGEESSPTPFGTPTASPTATATPIGTPVSTATPTSSPESTSTPLATATPTATASPTESPTGTPTVTGGVNIESNSLQDLINLLVKFLKSFGH